MAESESHNTQPKFSIDQTFRVDFGKTQSINTQSGAKITLTDNEAGGQTLTIESR